MANLIIKLNNKTQNRHFRIEVAFLTNSNEETPFVFGNSSKSLERVNLVVEDSALNILEPTEVIMIKPALQASQQTSISKTKHFIYEIGGTIEEEDNKILLSLASVSYLLKKNEQYSFYLKYKGAQSNIIKTSF